jgi:anthranilate synthase component II
MKILLLDNYDSFTFNLVHLVEQVSDYEVIVRRNNEIELSEFEAFDKIILSPGPGLPGEAGVMLDFIKQYYRSKSILGVCLGHQAIALSFGGELFNLETVFHGVATATQVVSDDELFRAIPKTFTSGRYHSWMVNKLQLPSELLVTATDSEGNCMALKHREFDLRGVQFHPESILTEYGAQLMTNWLSSSKS